jgi:hypothetical protein
MTNWTGLALMLALLAVPVTQAAPTAIDWQ